MKISVAQLNYLIGDFDGNYRKMAEAIEKAKTENSDIICFSELATCGYPPRDFLEFDDFIRLSEETISKLCALSHDIAIVVGSPSRNPVLEGKDLYNSAYFLYGGEIQFVQHKTLLPTYDIFDEYRYFEMAHEYDVVDFKGKKIALTVCEDIWNIGNENPLYKVNPMDEIMAHQPDFMINLSASPFTYDKAKTRLNIVRSNAKRYEMPVFYINHCGAQTEVIFDGGSCVSNSRGVIVQEMDYFKEEIQHFELKEIENCAKETLQYKDKMALIHDSLILGIQDYFGKLGFKKAIVGLSGGIDSAVTFALAAEALGGENVHGLLMPSQYSSDHSVEDAKKLAENVGATYDIVAIKDIFGSFDQELKPVFKDLPFNLTEENLQARIRGNLLMALSNKFGYIVLNTSNKSEAAVGYGTLYGDMCGGLSIIGDVYKTEVYELAKYINRTEEVIPVNSIQKPPSAELRPGQLDSDSLPPYDILDRVLYLYIEKRTDPADIIAEGYDKPLVDRILKLVNRNEFKRYQTAPILRVSSKAFGMGRRMPIVGKYLS